MMFRMIPTKTATRNALLSESLLEASFRKLFVLMCFFITISGNSNNSYSQYKTQVLERYVNGS